MPRPPVKTGKGGVDVGILRDAAVEVQRNRTTVMLYLAVQFITTLLAIGATAAFEITEPDALIPMSGPMV